MHGHIFSRHENANLSRDPMGNLPDNNAGSDLAIAAIEGDFDVSLDPNAGRTPARDTRAVKGSSDADPDFIKVHPAFLSQDPSLRPAYAMLTRLWHKGTQFLGSTYGILGGAMSWVSDHQLVAALSRAGGFGVLAGGALPPDVLEDEIIKTQALLQGRHTFGVSLISFHPQVDALVQVCVRLGVTHVFVGGGVPKETLLRTLKDAGIKVVGFAPSALLAKRLVRLGIDALVVEGHEAGGHVGPVSTAVLAQDILPVCPPDLPIFIAGGIGDGRAVASYLFMGASACQLGTRFVCATESRAHPRMKDAFIRAHSRDAVVSQALDPSFPVIPVRALENQGTQAFMQAQKEALAAFARGEIDQKEAHMRIELFWAGALRRAVLDGDVDHGSLMAGQSVGAVTAIEPCATIIETLVHQACQHIADRDHLCRHAS